MGEDLNIISSILETKEMVVPAVSYFAIIIGAIFVNNVVLAQFLGICQIGRAHV